MVSYPTASTVFWNRMRINVSPPKPFPPPREGGKAESLFSSPGRMKIAWKSIHPEVLTPRQKGTGQTGQGNEECWTRTHLISAVLCWDREEDLIRLLCQCSTAYWGDTEETEEHIDVVARFHKGNRRTRISKATVTRGQDLGTIFWHCRVSLFYFFNYYFLCVCTSCLWPF